jgi:hypothetical protein
MRTTSSSCFVIGYVHTYSVLRAPSVVADPCTCTSTLTYPLTYPLVVTHIPASLTSLCDAFAVLCYVLKGRSNFVGQMVGGVLGGVLSVATKVHSSVTDPMPV